MTKIFSKFGAVAVLVVTALMQTACLKSELGTGLTEAEAQEIIVLLKAHGFTASREFVAKGKDTGAWTVSVSGGNQNLRNIAAPPLRQIEEEQRTHDKTHYRRQQMSRRCQPQRHRQQNDARTPLAPRPL